MIIFSIDFFNFDLLGLNSDIKRSLNDLLEIGCGLSYPGEFGWGGVASTFFYIDPVRKISVIFMTQLIPSAANLVVRAQVRWLTHWLLDHKPFDNNENEKKSQS